MGGDAARQQKRMEMELADGQPRLTEDNWSEILLRLPAKDILHCRAVCRAWRVITTGLSFLTEHARRQERQVLLYRYVNCERPPEEWHSRGHIVQELVLEALNVSGDEKGRRSLIQYRKPRDRGWLLLAVVDGVLLFKNWDGQYTLCNPTTRKWADLPHLLSPGHPSVVWDDREYAFYFHQPSGEYRLLCRYDSTVDWKWCILSTGQAEPRNIYMEDIDNAVLTVSPPCLRMVVSAPLALHGRLHWPPYEGSVNDQTKIVVFHMLSETFTQMQGPPTTTGHLVKLFDMEGLLVAADFGQKMDIIDLWFLGNYGNATSWELRRRVAAPWGSDNYGGPLEPLGLMSVAAMADGEGNIILGNSHGAEVYNVKKKTLEAIDSKVMSKVIVSKHVFKENLVNHPHFSTRPAADLPFVHFH